MTRTSVPKPLAVVLTAILATTLLNTGEAGAQLSPERGFFGGMSTAVGYTAVLPDVLGGVGAWHMFGASRIGAFADAKFTTGSLTGESDYCPEALAECHVAWVQANRPDDGAPIRDEDEWVLLNVGAMYALSNEFAIMIGGGAARLRTVFMMVDARALDDEPPPPGELVTPSGRYFVDQEPDPTWQAQLVLGMLMRAGDRLAIRAGYETGPGAMSMGVYLVVR